MVLGISALVQLSLLSNVLTPVNGTYLIDNYCLDTYLIGQLEGAYLTGAYYQVPIQYDPECWEEVATAEHYIMKRGIS